MEINFTNLRCPKCGEKKLIKIELNLCYCDCCQKKFAYVDNEFMIERRINGILEYFAVRKSYSKSPFSKRNSPTENRKFSFGFY